MPEPSAIERDLQRLATELRRLEVEYNLFFAGRVPRPPSETRSRVEALLKRYDKGQIDNLPLRFRFSTLQARFSTFADLWDRGLRAREEGRPGPFAHARQPPVEEAAAASPDRLVQVVSFRDPLREIDKLHDLYEGLMDARRENGEEIVPFHKFAELVKEQVLRLTQTSGSEVAFRVSTKDGKTTFTARALKGATE